MLILCWILCILKFLTISNAGSPFADPVETSYNVEYYDNGNVRFAIYTTFVTWKEARMLCPAKGGRLMELRTEEISVFIGRALAESAISYGSLWIGGDYNPPTKPATEGDWSWISNKTIIDSKLPEVKEFPMKVLPYWVDRPNVTVKSPMCLATARKMHHLALIVGQPCHKKRPYICQLPAAGSNETNEVYPPVIAGDRRFHIFRSESTWQESLSQCRMLGFELAKLTTAREFSVIGNRMMRARPIMENAWIGGMFSNDIWTWISTSDPINVDESKETSDEPFVWYRPDEIIMDGCLLADRHVCDHFVYVEAKCTRRRNFICEEVVESTEVDPLIPVPDAPDWWISTYKEDWDRAQNMCNICLQGELMQLIDLTKEGMDADLQYLFSAMAIALKIEVRHIWIGAYLFEDKFKWTHNKNLNPTSDEYTVVAEVYKNLSTGGTVGTIAYCEVNFELESYLLEFKCLNLDRENQKNFFMYGLACHIKQYFLCKSSPDWVLDPKCRNPPGSTTVTPPSESTVTDVTQPLPSGEGDEVLEKNNLTNI